MHHIQLLHKHCNPVTSNTNTCNRMHRCGQAQRNTTFQHTHPRAHNTSSIAPTQLMHTHSWFQGGLSRLKPICDVITPAQFAKTLFTCQKASVHGLTWTGSETVGIVWISRNGLRTLLAHERCGQPGKRPRGECLHTMVVNKSQASHPRQYRAINRYSY